VLTEVTRSEVIRSLVPIRRIHDAVAPAVQLYIQSTPNPCCILLSILCTSATTGHDGNDTAALGNVFELEAPRVNRGPRKPEREVHMYSAYKY
jgi:hypothetical protein